jgi:hypothetical protein
MTDIKQKVLEALDEVLAGNRAADPKIWGPALKRYLTLLGQLTPEQQRDLLNDNLRVIERATGRKGVTVTMPDGETTTYYGRDY